MISKKIKKIIMSFIIIFIMFVGLNVNAQDYELYANGVQFSDDNLVVPCGDGTATFDPATKTLTLENATLTESADDWALITDNINSGVLNVVLIGNNVFDGADYYDGFDIDSEGISFSGTGTLTMNNTFAGVFSNNSEASLSISGITMTINVGNGGQGFAKVSGITLTNSTVSIISDNPDGKSIDTEGGSITINNSNLSINSVDGCVYMGGDDAGRQFVVNSGSVSLTAQSGYALAASSPNNATIVVNGGKLSLNGAEGGTTISNVEIADGYAMTKGDGIDSREIEIAPAVTISGNVSWIDNDNEGNTRPSSMMLLVKNPGGQTVAYQEVKASQNWAYSMQVAMYDDSGNPISYTIVADGATGYNTLVAGYNVTMILDGMSTDEVFPSITTLTKVVATGTLKDLEGQTIDTKDYSSDNITGTTTDPAVASKINEFKEGFNTWAAENDATGSTTSEEITAIYFKSDQVGDTEYATLDDVVAAYKNNGGTGVLNVNKVQTYTMVYEAVKNPEREKTTIAGSIDWEDSANQDGKRPGQVTVSIKNGATIVESKTVTAANNWQYSFEGLFVQDTEGNNITYTLEGSAVNGYTISLDGNNLVYSHTPETTTIAGNITWNDNNNALGLRPENISIVLLKNGIAEDSQTKSEGMYIFANLPKYSGGEQIDYTIQVNSVENYLSSLSRYDITMNCKKQVISGQITWNDDDNINNSRPLQVEVQVKANNETVETKTLSSVTNWKFSSTVDKYDSSNNDITYTVTYPNVEDYDKSVSGFNATYTYAVTTVTVSGRVNWSDDDNRDGLRPTKVVVTLYNGSIVVSSQDVSSSTGWAYSFSGLAKKDDQGNTNNYSVQAQTGFTGYDFAQSGNNFNYSHTPERINISGSVTWNDNDNQDNIRPAGLTVELKNGNSSVREANVSGPNWAYEFNNLYKYANGQVINYSIAPKYEVTRYTSETSGYNLIMAHTHEVISVAGKVTWNDNNDQDGFRPTSLEVGVYVGTERVRFTEVNESNGWNYSFPDLDQYDNEGNEITYTIKSNDSLTGYSYSTSGYNITYTHTSETVGVSGTISWNDNNNALGLRPTTVKVTLLANDSEVKNVNVTESDNWEFSFTNLPKYQSGGEVTYTVSTQSFDAYSITSEGNNFTYVCNKIKLTGQISFEDANNQDGKRPTNVKATIKNGDDTVKEVTVSESTNWKFEEMVDKYDSSSNTISYTVSYPSVDDYSKETSGNNVTYTHTPEKRSVSGTIRFDDVNNQDRIRPSKVTITLKNGQATVDTKEVNISGETTDFEFTGVDKYASGSEITYTFVASAVTDYEVTVDGSEITYTHAIATTRVEGKIIWNDSNNQDGKRPGQVEVTLSTGAKKIVTSVDNWNFSFTGLPKYDSGELINYSVSSPDNIEGYSYSKDGYQITYTHTPEKANIQGKIIISDNNNQDGIRPSKVTLNIDNGTQTVTREITIEGNTTNYSITDLPKYSSGSEITYNVNGAQVNRYTISKDGNDITYTHTPDKVTISGQITFDDSNNQDGKRPTEVEITLSNGDKATASQATSWKYEFKNLPKNENGSAITYTITAPDVENYTKQVTGNNVKYTHQKETISVSGTISFDDENNKYGFRPNEVTVTIKNGSTTVKTIKVNNSNNWKYNATLDKYSNGTEVNYTISTNNVSNYKLTNNSPNFTYKCTKIKITVKAKFNDNNDESGLRPTKVTLGLFGNTSQIDTIELTESDKYTKTLTLDKYASDDTEIAYTISPETVDSYEVTASDYEATYTYNGAAKKKVTGQITWNDSSDKTRPESVTVVLYQDGIEYNRIAVTKDNDWKYIFRGLPKENDEGTEIEYTIDVEQVNGYTSSIEGNNVILDKINYRIIEGNEQLFVVSEDSEASFRINADYSLFDKLYIDEKLVDEDNYVVTEGSTIITLKDSFTKSLSSGKHSIRATFTDGGEASGSFMVEKPSTEESVKEIINPTTGDKLILYILIAITSTLGIYVTKRNMREAN